MIEESDQTQLEGNSSKTESELTPKPGLKKTSTTKISASSEIEKKSTTAPTTRSRRASSKTVDSSQEIPASVTKPSTTRKQPLKSQKIEESTENILTTSADSDIPDLSENTVEANVEETPSEDWLSSRIITKTELKSSSNKLKKLTKEKAKEKAKKAKKKEKEKAKKAKKKKSTSKKKKKK